MIFKPSLAVSSSSRQRQGLWQAVPVDAEWDSRTQNSLFFILLDKMVRMEVKPSPLEQVSQETKVLFAKEALEKLQKKAELKNKR
jgi:hypothetical protein